MKISGKTDKSRKRIIWAPHFSISDGGCLNYSTFLSIAEELLEFIKNTQLPVQMAFKPHPLLKSQLYNYSSWGKEKNRRVLCGMGISAECSIGDQ